mmetsp:Transcript_21629/g.30539  ORF Transcript_21629/g.30539 Transcript_21629/m.30539 type:complete len:121 (-) Transcript_21629:254-616(-)
MSIINIVGKHVKLLCNDHLSSGEVQIVSKVVGVLTMKMRSTHVYHHKDRNCGLDHLGRENEAHSVYDKGRNKLVDPLNTKCKLKQEGTEKKGEQMPDFSIRKIGHDNTKWVAQKQPKRVT